MADYIDNLSDSELADFADNFSTVLNAAPGTYFATAAQAAEVQSEGDGFDADLATHIAAQAAAKSNTKKKNVRRDTYEKKVRFIIKQARLNGTPEEEIIKLGVPSGYGGDQPTNATRPIIFISTAERLRHLAGYADEADPDSKRRPRLVKWFELFRKKDGDPPVDLKECEFLGADTEPPYLVEYPGADAGMMIHYIGRWRFRDDSTSPLSETVSATVAG